MFGNDSCGRGERVGSLWLLADEHAKTRQRAIT